MQLQTEQISLQGCVNLILRHFLLSSHPNALTVYRCTIFEYIKLHCCFPLQLAVYRLCI